MIPFDDFWGNLQTGLKTPQKITNWTIKKGVTGDSFTAKVKNNQYITCVLPSGSDQHIPKKDFQLIYDNWNDYVSERIQRIDLVHGDIGNSRFTKYTISIIHHFLKK